MLRSKIIAPQERVLGVAHIAKRFPCNVLSREFRVTCKAGIIMCPCVDTRISDSHLNLAANNVLHFTCVSVHTHIKYTVTERGLSETAKKKKLDLNINQSKSL